MGNFTLAKGFHTNAHFDKVGRVIERLVDTTMLDDVPYYDGTPTIFDGPNTLNFMRSKRFAWLQSKFIVDGGLVYGQSLIDDLKPRRPGGAGMFHYMSPDPSSYFIGQYSADGSVSSVVQALRTNAGESDKGDADYCGEEYKKFYSSGGKLYSWMFSFTKTGAFSQQFIDFVHMNWMKAEDMMRVDGTGYSSPVELTTADLAPTAERPAPECPKIKGVVGMKEQVAALHAAMTLGKPCLLVGPTGCGKTYLVNRYHEWLNKERKSEGLAEIPLAIHTFHQDSSPSEIVGKPTLKSGDVTWVRSRFMQAFEEGGLYFADEFNFAPSGAHAPLFAALNGDEEIYVPEEGKTYKRHADFRFVAACNPASKYAGRQPLDKALASRFMVSATFGYLKPVQEKKLVMERVHGLTLAEAEKVVSFANAMRKAENDGEIFYPFGTRDAIHLAHLVVAGFAWEDAVDLAFAGKIDNDEQAQIVLKAVGSELKRCAFAEADDKEVENLKLSVAALKADLERVSKEKAEVSEKMAKLKSALA